MAKEMIAMLLAGGQGSRLYALTEKLAKPAVPFGGKYRIIDFPLSNCVNSGIDTVGILTVYMEVCIFSRHTKRQADLTGTKEPQTQFIRIFPLLSDTHRNMLLFYPVIRFASRITAIF